jgi:hypothetical protein
MPLDGSNAAGSSAGSSGVLSPPGPPSLSREEMDMDVDREHRLNERELLKKLREPMVRSLWTLSVWWLVGCFVLLILKGFGEFIHFNLADSVLIAAITTTTANVLAMLVVVVRFIFPDRK